MTNTKGISAKRASGRNLHVIPLERADGRWIGNVILEYDDAARWGRLYSITDYGNYAAVWTSVPRKGFERFIAEADPEYLIDKLASCHDEALVVDVDTTAEKLVDLIGGKHSEDADYLIETIADLRRCETERDLWTWIAEHKMILDDWDVDYATVYCRGAYLDGYKKYVLGALQAYLQGREVADETDREVG